MASRLQCSRSLLVLGLILWFAASLQAQPATRVAPLQPPGTGAAGFTTVASSVSGVQFTNLLSPQAAAQNQNLMNGSGVAAGDVDGDGRCDLYFCAINGTNALYRNLGGWRFEEIAVQAGVACPNWVSTGAVFADMDGDGDLDLFVSTLGKGVHCFRNDGKGHFTEVTEWAGLTSTAGSMSLALADIDGDGDLDLYVANYGALSVLKTGGRAQVQQVNGQWVVTGPHAHRLRIVDGRLEEVGEVGVLYLNDGTGRFQAAPWNSSRFLDEDGRPKPPPADYGLSVQIRDVNGDGAPDIYVCNDFQTPDRLWINDGRGNFREASHQAIRKFPFSSMGVDFADVDRDGVLDYFAVEMAGRTHATRMRQMSGISYQPNLPGRYLYRPEVNRNALYRGNGDNTWSELADFAGLAATDWAWQPVFLDVDLDGYEDLLVVNGMMFDLQDRDALARVRSLGKQTQEAARTNLMAYPPYGSPSVAFRNRGGFNFEERSRDWGFGVAGVAQGVAVADLDGDGYLDLAINRLNDSPVLLRNQGSGHRIVVRLKGRAPNTAGIGGRIRVLGGPVTQTQEIVAGGRYLSGDDPIRMFAAGAAAQLTLEVTWRSGLQTRITNAAPDHLYEISELDAQPALQPPVQVPAPIFAEGTGRIGLLHHEELYDDFARQPLLPKQLSSLGPGVAWFDFDGDGHEELVIGTGRGGTLQGTRLLPNGQLQSLRSDWVAPDDVIGFAGWVGADGKPALLASVANYELVDTNASGLVMIRCAPGTTNFLVTPVAGTAAAEFNTGPLAVADIDGSGTLTVFAGGRAVPGAYPRATRSGLYRRDGNGLKMDLSPDMAFEGVGLVNGAVWSDLNGDGYPELILACEWGPIRIFRNDHGRLVAWDPPVESSTGGHPVNGPLSSLTGWWTSVTTGDFDGDGQLDVVVGNWGLNTGYRASAERPLRLYHGQLGGSETMDLVEAYYPEELTTEMPRRSFSALGRALPFLSAQFPTHMAFAQATITDLFSLCPAKPSVVASATLSSTLFLNRGDHFLAVPLPMTAQLAPAFGVTVADADGDGHEDLFVAQNFFAMRPEWSRTDAGRGVWLRGDGAGRFAAMPAQESGVAVYGEQRGAAVGDFDEDGRPDLLVAQNGAATTFWHNRRGRSGLRVRLAGPAGNPSGYGAAIRLHFAGRKGPIREVHAGSGYGSQDSAIQILARPAEATAIEVRWPGGESSVHPIPADAREVRLHREGSIEVRK